MLSDFDAGPGRLTHHTSSQLPHAHARSLSECLALPLHKLRLVAPDIGGGFGAKLGFYAEDVICAFLLNAHRPPMCLGRRTERKLSRDYAWTFHIYMLNSRPGASPDHRPADASDRRSRSLCFGYGTGRARERHHHHAGRAVTALKRVVFPDRRLHRMERSAGWGQALDGYDLLVFTLQREHRTRLHGQTVHVHDTGSALRGVAADVRACQTLLAPEKVNEHRASLNLTADSTPIHCHRYFRHRASPSIPVHRLAERPEVS